MAAATREVRATGKLDVDKKVFTQRIERGETLRPHGQEKTCQHIALHCAQSVIEVLDIAFEVRIAGIF